MRSFEIRKYLHTHENWSDLTLVQVLPCFNFGWHKGIITGEERFNVALGWLFWILEWSWWEEDDGEVL